MKSFTPNPRYLRKLFLVMTVIALLVIVSGLLLSWPIGLDEGPEVAGNIIRGTFILNLLWYIPALILIGPYYRSLKYEIRDDEVIVHVGIWTRSVKHVPFRTVTNLKVNRDIFDRWFFGLGSLNIQTAGMSGNKGAEESLVGLQNIDEIYEIVGSRLRQYRGAMSPNAAEEDDSGKEATLEAILTEIKGIRSAVEK